SRCFEHLAASKPEAATRTNSAADPPSLDQRHRPCSVRVSTNDAALRGLAESVLAHSTRQNLGPPANGAAPDKHNRKDEPRFCIPLFFGKSSAEAQSRPRHRHRQSIVPVQKAQDWPVRLRYLQASK